MVWEDLTPNKIQSRKAFENAITVAMAMGCSTNAIIHLIAQARRAGQDISLDDFEKASREVPVIANVRPSGDLYLMADATDMERARRALRDYDLAIRWTECQQFDTNLIGTYQWCPLARRT